jgi:hypothetical protein
VRFVLASTLLAAGCTPPSTAPPAAASEASDTLRSRLTSDSLAGVFEGYYSAGFEHAGFRPCADTHEAWWTEPAVEAVPIGRDQHRIEMDPAADVDARYRGVVGGDEGVYGEGPVVWARFRGRATPRRDAARGAGYGHEGAYSRAFAVDSVLAMSADPPTGACARPPGVRP